MNKTNLLTLILFRCINFRSNNFPTITPPSSQANITKIGKAEVSKLWEIFWLICSSLNTWEMIFLTRLHPWWVMAEFNVFGSCNMDGCLIVTTKDHRLCDRKMKFLYKSLSTSFCKQNVLYPIFISNTWSRYNRLLLTFPWYKITILSIFITGCVVKCFNHQMIMFLTD